MPGSVRDRNLRRVMGRPSWLELRHYLDPLTVHRRLDEIRR